MAEDIKTLIEKINQEGVLAAQVKAREIENHAQLKAEEILKNTKAEAEKILIQAEDRVAKLQEKEKKLLTQAARDTLLVLRQEINAMLDRLITKEVGNALTPEVLSKIIGSVIRDTCNQAKTEMIVSLNEDDLRALESGFLSQLKNEVKKEILLKPAEDLRAGFVISYDAGKSQFDFSDKALTEYIGTYLKPKLKDILQF